MAKTNLYIILKIRYKKTISIMGATVYPNEATLPDLYQKL